MTPMAAPPPATTSSIPTRYLLAVSWLVALSPILLTSLGSGLSRLADIPDGEHSNELSILGDRQRPKPTLLQDGKTILEKVSLGRDCGYIRFHQLTHARVPLRGVGCAHDLVAREHTHQLFSGRDSRLETPPIGRSVMV